MTEEELTTLGIERSKGSSSKIIYVRGGIAETTFDDEEELLWSEEAARPWHSKGEYWGGIYFTNKRAIVASRFARNAYTTTACPYELVSIENGVSRSELIFSIAEGKAARITLKFSKGAYARIRNGYSMAKNNQFMD